MIELKLKNRKGSFHVNSKEVKDIIAARQDIGYLQDISNSINQDNIMVFDCELSEMVFSKEEILEAIEALGETVDESFFEIMFDDIRRFLKDTTDEIEEELQDVYCMDNIKFGRYKFCTCTRFLFARGSFFSLNLIYRFRIYIEFI